MRTVRRITCALLALLCLVSLAPPRVGAASTVCFTAVNDTLLTLSDETMPFWSGGVLYVSSEAFDGTDLGVYYSRSRDKSLAVLYRQRSVITFDLAEGTVETNTGQSVSGSPIVRGDIVFFPLAAICRFFGFEYSYTHISYGFLLRIKSDAVVLSDAAFIDAAGAPMAQRYARYERAKLPQVPDDPAPPPPDNTPSAPPSPPAAEPQPTAERTVYFAVESTAAAETAQAMARLSAGRAVYLFAPENLDGAEELLRRLASGGGAAALRIDGSGGAAHALAQIEEANRAIWAAANMKTRLVRLDGAAEETVKLVAEAGYCPLSFTLDFGGETVSASRASARILAAADANGGSCSVFLGADTGVSASLGALLGSLRAENCTPARLNEAIITQR